METVDFTVGVFGDPEILKSLGEKNNISDIAMYSLEHTYPGGSRIITYVSPHSDKIQPILQSVRMADIPVLVINEMTKDIGELLIAIDMAGFKKGFILLKDESLRPQLSQIIKDTTLANFEIMPKDAAVLKQKLIEYPVEKKDEKEDCYVAVDTFFSVKSVGIVILGIVKKGVIKEYDKLAVEPIGREVTIRSIQSHDKTVKTAPAGTRVGLAVKGVEVEELKRGFVVAKKDSFKKGSSFTLELSKSKYYRGDISAGMKFFLNVGLQVIALTVKDIEKKDESHYIISGESEKPVAYMPGDLFILAGDGAIPRIAGNGKIL